MKSFKSKNGPFAERPFFDEAEIERLCVLELRAQKLYPESPEPVRIDRFIEKRFGVTPTYFDLPEGILGFTQFDENGVKEVVISRSLDEEGTDASHRRVRSTLAHESGHGLLHAQLFVLRETEQLFDGEVVDSKVLCRDVQGEAKLERKYDGRWWEYQANLMIPSLLMPRTLTSKAVSIYLESDGITLNGGRAEAVRNLSHVFDVNPAVVRLRLEKLYPPSGGHHKLLI